MKNSHHRLPLIIGFAVLVLLAGMSSWLSGCASNNPNGPASEAAAKDLQQAGATGVIATPTSLIGTVRSDTGVTTPYHVLVELWKSGGAGAYKQAYSLVNGDFVFDNIEKGAFEIRVMASGSLSATSLAVNILEGPNTLTTPITMVDTADRATVPTADVQGILIAILDKTPISVAQVTLDGDAARSVVTNALGEFAFKYVPAGDHTITVTKSGLIASYTIRFVLEGPLGQPNVATFTFAGIATETRISSTGARRIADLGQVSITYDIYSSGMLIGSVLQYRYSGDVDTNPVTNEKMPLSNWAFELWAVDPKGNSSRYTTVVTDASGTYKVDNIPAMEDNSYSWMALATGTQVVAVRDFDGKPTGEFTIGNPYSPWTTPTRTISPTLTLNAFRIQKDKATVMDLVLPDGLPIFYKR